MVGGGLSKNLIVQDVCFAKDLFVVFFSMNTYDDVFGVSTKKSEQVGGGQRGSAFKVLEKEEKLEDATREGQSDRACLP